MNAGQDASMQEPTTGICAVVNTSRPVRAWRYAADRDWCAWCSRKSITRWRQVRYSGCSSTAARSRGRGNGSDRSLPPGGRAIGHQDQPIGEVERLVDVVRHHDDDLALVAPTPAAACPAARTASSSRASRTARRAAETAAAWPARAPATRTAACRATARAAADRRRRRRRRDRDSAPRGRRRFAARGRAGAAPSRARRSRAPSATAAATATERPRRDRPRARHFLAVDHHAAQRRPLQARDDRQHRRLAASRVAENADELPVVDRRR